MQIKPLQKTRIDEEFPGPIPGHFPEPQENRSLSPIDIEAIEEYRRRRDAAPPTPAYVEHENLRPNPVISITGAVMAIVFVGIAAYGVTQAALGIMSGVLSAAETVGRYVAIAGGIALAVLFGVTLIASSFPRRKKEISQRPTITQIVYYNDTKNG